MISFSVLAWLRPVGVPRLVAADKTRLEGARYIRTRYSSVQYCTVPDVAT